MEEISGKQKDRADAERERERALLFQNCQHQTRNLCELLVHHPRGNSTSQNVFEMWLFSL